MPLLVIAFATRINAEQAMLRGKSFKDKQLQVCLLFFSFNNGTYYIYIFFYVDILGHTKYCTTKEM